MCKCKETISRALLPLLCAVLLLGLLVGSARAVSTVTARLSPDYTIVIDGTERTFYNVSGQQVHPLAYSGTTYLPVRAIGELMDRNVDWNETTKTITLSGKRTADASVDRTTPDASAKAKDVSAELRDDFTVIVDGSKRTFADVNGKTVYPLLYNGSTYLPVRAIGELMGKSVSWDGSTSTVTLSGSTVTDADSFSGGQSAPSQGILTVEEAKAKALKHAGVTEAIFTKEKLDWDDGRQEYEFEFYAGGQEYEYEIDAKTGDILSHEVESGTPPTSSGSAITLEKAREIALAKVPGAAASDIKKLKLDRDDGKQIYEVEIIYKEMEYEMEIDASSGKVLEFSSESIYD
jgi:uncharacterized membrane protein YkoI